MISWVILLAYFVTAVQGILSRCELLAILSGVSLLISFALVFRDSMSHWLRWVCASVFAGFLAGMAVFSVMAYLRFGQAILEYAFTAIESVLMMALTIALFVPTREAAEQ